MSHCVEMTVLLTLVLGSLLSPTRSFNGCTCPARFITIGGYRLLNSWLTHSKCTSNAPMLQLILLTLQNLPLRVEHLKQVTPSLLKGNLLPRGLRLTSTKMLFCLPEQHGEAGEAAE